MSYDNIEDAISDAPDNMIMEEFTRINLSEEQCLTFIGELCEKLRKKFHKVYYLIEKEGE